MRKGWFIIPGVQNGDRTLEDQRKGLEVALAEVAAAKDSGTPMTVLDVGCAEALISREFALAGASDVYAVDTVAEHLEVAAKVCADVPQVRIENRNLLALSSAHTDQHDIVLALGVCHKLRQPRPGLEFVARSARKLLCFRNAGRSAQTGIVIAKHDPNAQANAWKIFQAAGLRKDRVEKSSRDEVVEYWRRD